MSKNKDVRNIFEKFLHLAEKTLDIRNAEFFIETHPAIPKKFVEKYLQELLKKEQIKFK